MTVLFALLAAGAPLAALSPLSDIEPTKVFVALCLGQSSPAQLVGLELIHKKNYPGWLMSRQFPRDAEVSLHRMADSNSYLIRVRRAPSALFENEGSCSYVFNGLASKDVYYNLINSLGREAETYGLIKLKSVMMGRTTIDGPPATAAFVATTIPLKVHPRPDHPYFSVVANDDLRLVSFKATTRSQYKALEVVYLTKRAYKYWK